MVATFNDLAKGVILEAIPAQRCHAFRCGTKNSRAKSLFHMNVVAAALSTAVRLGLQHRNSDERRKRRARASTAIGTGILLASVLMPSSTQTAIANGDTRTLNLQHAHTGESIQATFRVNGAYDPAVLEKLNWFLRDWRNNDKTTMDPRLFDVVWEVYRSAGVTQPVVIYSAYRSPATNAMLRRRSSGVAEYSLHMRGMAMDTTLPGMSMQRIREIGMRLQRGGVGYYPGSNFVHLDVGNVRSWPRMSYDQLVRLFPDGKTVHLASNGRALPRFEEARAEIAARGGAAQPVLAQRSGGGLFAWLFGNRAEEDETDTIRSAQQQRGRVMTASLKRGETAERRGAPARAEQTRPERTRAEQTKVASLALVSNDLRPSQGTELLAAPQASTESGRRNSLAAVPMPPPRPQDQTVLTRLFTDVPEPPTRPGGLAAVAVAAIGNGGAAEQPAAANDAPGGLMNKPKTGEPIARAANLPVVITQGPKDAPILPPRVLAYASTDEARDAGMPKASRPPVASARIEGAAAKSLVAPARLDRSNYRGATSQAAIASTAAQSLLGPAFTGLRQAARISPDILSPVPSIGYVAVFAAKATDLDCTHFTGAATKPLEMSPGLVRIVESSLRLNH
jgi:uncharacterized protein YcbK (DUF882 family)